jgi:phage terminase large subunit
MKEINLKINPVYRPALYFAGRYLVLYGGSGSGKSYFAADKILLRVMTEDKHNILCCRDTSRSVSKSQFPLLEGEIKRLELYEQFKVNHSQGNEAIQFLPNGNKIIFSGLDKQHCPV